MGVQGLTTYVEGNRNFLQHVRFRDSRLVIDGCSLYFRLYFTYGLDQPHGGDYDAFALLLSQFLSALEACNIQPYVVLDGGLDPSDKKFPTVRERLLSNIKKADSISHGRNGSVLPILTRDVFIQVLLQRGVPLFQCPAEADWEIACLARQWKCPVLTSDSDFYIFDLPGGYLPFQFFQWTNLNGKASHQYIPAQCYTTNRFCHWFGGMNQELLPLCAVLAGNDYGAPKEAERLLSILDLSESARGGRGSAATFRIEGILLWLSAFSSPAEALEKVSRLMGEDGRRSRQGQDGLSSQLWAAMQEYNIASRSSLARWFSGSKAAPGGPNSGFAKLPESLSQVAAQGLLAPFIIDALGMRRVLLMPQVENSKLASSHCSARAIRQAIYGILLQRGPDNMALAVGDAMQVHGTRVQENISQDMRGGRGREARGRGKGWAGRDQGNSLPTQHGVNIGFSHEQTSGASVQAQGSTASVCVQEYDRLDLNLKKTQVEANPLRTPINLETLGQAPVAVRLAALLEALGVNSAALSSVPLHLKLAVAVTGFWLRQAVPKPSQPQLQALLLGMVYGELSSNSQPGATHYPHGGPKVNWAAERNVWTALDRRRVRSGERRGIDLAVAHSLSQWQACLWSGMCLNQLLLQPLPDPHLSWLYSGTLVHGVIRYLKGGGSAESLLAGGSSSGQLYSSLLDAAIKCSFKANPSSYVTGSRKRGGGRGRRGRRGGGRGARGEGQGATADLNNKFALLMSEEDFDSD
ncbi:protein asteroid homolog 1 [Betta splendens]|uniref:Protein asteroid homolog 1 n=1 Tax=Betta splendens TaxID=158456 RepID=A0A6P7NY90_BETSP|nr:protein asteroid homolog 1 [Betta splendens]